MKSRPLCVALVLSALFVCIAAVTTLRRNGTALQTSDSKPNAPEEVKPTFWQQAHQWRMDAWRNANGSIPANGLALALENRDQYLHHNLDTSGFGDIPVSHLTWVSRGPNNVGGRTRAVIVEPHAPGDPAVVWAGSAGGGVWRSSDTGTTWVALNDPMQNYIVGSLAMDTNDSAHRTLYAGTGEHAFNEGGMPGGGMYRTTDGGMSWTQIPSTDPRVQNNSHGIELIASPLSQVSHQALPPSFLRQTRTVFGIRLTEATHGFDHSKRQGKVHALSHSIPTMEAMPLLKL